MSKRKRTLRSFVPELAKRYKTTDIWRWIEKGDYETVKYFFEQGLNPNIRHRHGLDLPRYAVRYCPEDSVYLIAALCFDQPDFKLQRSSFSCPCDECMWRGTYLGSLVCRWYTNEALKLKLVKLYFRQPTADLLLNHRSSIVLGKWSNWPLECFQYIVSDPRVNINGKGLEKSLLMTYLAQPTVKWERIRILTSLPHARNLWCEHHGSKSCFDLFKSEALRLRYLTFLFMQVRPKLPRNIWRLILLRLRYNELSELSGVHVRFADLTFLVGIPWDISALWESTLHYMTYRRRVGEILSLCRSVTRAEILQMYADSKV